MATEKEVWERVWKEQPQLASSISRIHRDINRCSYSFFLFFAIYNSCYGFINPELIAIVGIGCRLPGGVTSSTEVWDVLRQGRTSCPKC